MICFQMGQCITGFKDAQADPTNDQRGYKKIFSLKRPHDSFRGSPHECSSAGLASDRGAQQEFSSSQAPPKRPYIDPRCGANYIRNMGDSMIDDNTLTRSQPCDATFTVAGHSHCSLPNCPHNTPVTPKQSHSTPITSSRPCPCSLGARALCQSPTQDSTSADMFASQHNPGDASLVTIHSMLSKIDKNQEKQLAVLDSVSHDTNRLANDSQLFLTASGTFLDSTAASSLGRQYNSPHSKRIRVFQDSPPVPTRADTPMPYPWHSGFGHSARANLTHRFDQMHKSESEQASGLDASTNWDETNTSTLADSPEKSKNN